MMKAFTLQSSRPQGNKKLFGDIAMRAFRFEKDVSGAGEASGGGGGGRRGGRCPGRGGGGTSEQLGMRPKFYPPVHTALSHKRGQGIIGHQAGPLNFLPSQALRVVLLVQCLCTIGRLWRPSARWAGTFELTVGHRPLGGV